MDFDLVVNSRRSIRKFTDDVVSDSDILKIIECGIKAPSAKNRQPWRVKVVSSKDKDMIASFLELLLSQIVYLITPSRVPVGLLEVISVF